MLLALSLFPPSLQHPLLPLSQHPLFLSFIAPSLHSFAPGVEGGLINVPDSDMEDDSHVDDSPFSAPLDRDFKICGDEEKDRLEVNSSWHCAISLNSPPKVNLAQLLLFIINNILISPTASQTSLSMKPQSFMSLQNKRTLVADMEGQISMLNDKIKSMHSDMSEYWELRNKCYTLKMNYQSQQKEHQWRCGDVPSPWSLSPSS
ncbi:hypothetical protein DFJ58DRAFT_838758 [Suillus subalutaceus]|uniref:uncharacterized protein n=1 Tax=Suillus subalutaceus TaxID=48586 RepID=UPI001B877E5A|nr:uncharacterized protein DFJ58DRAFT_838758 [Suillus subalutaceus]KAG1865022.1 hypothetical protein DFJ58DRAFT_838758 [Suillus subalutaceus]